MAGVAALAVSSAAGAQEVSGYIDANYAYNRNRPSTPCEVVNDVPVFNCLHAFDVARNAFGVDLVNIALQKTPSAGSRIGFRVDLLFGQGTTLVAPSAGSQPAALQHIEQAYGSYLASEKHHLQFDVGKFVTPAGFERVDPGADWNGSRSLLFTLAIPREEIGARAVYRAGDRLALTGMVMNGWDDVAQAAGERSVGGSISVRPVHVLTVSETYLAGPESPSAGGVPGWRSLSDTAVLAQVTRDLSAAVNVDAGTDRSTQQSWQGAAAYVRYQVTDWFAIAPRVEGLRDHTGFMTGVAQDLQEATATAEFKHREGLLTRVEYRVDVADHPYFLRGVSTTAKTQSVVSANFVVLFNSRHAGPWPDPTPLALRNQ